MPVPVPVTISASPSTTVTRPSLRLPGPNGAVATCEASTCMRGWSCPRATAKAANGFFAIARGPRSAVREPSTRIDWAELLKRVHDVDALACQCGGRLNFIALILDDGPASAILDSLHLSSEAPPIARARSPDLADPVPVREVGPFDYSARPVRTRREPSRTHECA